MLEEAIPSFLASFHTWLTPSVLFVLLNIVIGTIAVTCKASRREDEAIPPVAVNEGVGSKLSRSSSAVLHRIRSFSLHLHRTAQTPLDPTPPLPLASATGPNEPDPAPKDFAVGKVGEIDHQLSRSQLDSCPVAEERETKLAAQTKKSASEKLAFGHLEEAEILPHADGDLGEERGEVDARADDFINRFRLQLKAEATAP